MIVLENILNYGFKICMNPAINETTYTYVNFIIMAVFTKITNSLFLITWQWIIDYKFIYKSQ